MSAAAVNEEAQKKNTDCVYFLASPLTCKKGNDCEFRHSDSARNNPRDSWYWLSGACLNAYCAFRHLPLEGLPEDAATGAAVGGKSRVPCYYFMQGYCTKGDRCNFMHGMRTASALEVCQGMPISNIDKAVDLLDNETSAHKVNGMVASRVSSEIDETSCDVGHVPDSKSNQDRVAVISNRLLEGTGSSAPATHHCRLQSEESNQGPAPNGSLHQLEASDNKRLLQEAQPEEERPCELEPGEEMLAEDLSGEDRAHNGTESEEMWEESSFDVLVDDGGMDQFVYADELDYLNSCDSVVDQVRGHIQVGMLGADGFVDFDYDHASGYCQYYDASVEYDLATYDTLEQQLVYEHLGSSEHNNAIISAVAYKNRQQRELHPPDTQEMSFDGHASHSTVNTYDLRNQIVRRRRADRNQNLSEVHHRIRRRGNGYAHNYRHQDRHSEPLEVLTRCRTSAQTAGRSSRNLQGRGDSLVGRKFHGRLGEQHIGGKRTFRERTLYGRSK